jgi:hypothetical protein
MKSNAEEMEAADARESSLMSFSRGVWRAYWVSWRNISTSFIEWVGGETWVERVWRIWGMKLREEIQGSVRVDTAIWT